VGFLGTVNRKDLVMGNYWG